MIKTLFRRLFLSDKKRSEITRDLQSNSNFQSKEQNQQHELDTTEDSNFTLEKGKVQSIFAPNLGSQKGLVLTKWYVKSGDIIKKGTIVCTIENENIVMEFESIFSGKTITTCKLNQKLTSEIELFKIEGI